MENTSNHEAICCTLNPFQLEERKKVLQHLSSLVRERTELENGFIFRFEGNNEHLDRIISIVKLERQCCSFLTFELNIGNLDDFISLKITGPDATKEFLIAELGL